MGSVHSVQCYEWAFGCSRVAVVMKWSAANCNGLSGAGPRVTVFLSLFLLLRHSNCAAFEAVMIIGIITFCFSLFGI